MARSDVALSSRLCDTLACGGASNIVLLDSNGGQCIHGIEGHAHLGTGCTGTRLDATVPSVRGCIRPSNWERLDVVERANLVPAGVVLEREVIGLEIFISCRPFNTTILGVKDLTNRKIGLMDSPAT